MEKTSAENETRKRVEQLIERGLPTTEVEIVSDPDLYPDGANPSETDVILRVTTPHPTDDAIWGDMSRGSANTALYDHLREQLVDSIIIESKFPPQRAVNQSCIFYIQAAM